MKDPATNAESARSLSRYPAGHGEGYGGAFRNLFSSIYAAIEAAGMHRFQPSGRHTQRCAGT